VRSLTLAAALLLGACQDRQREITDIQAMSIADVYVAKHYPMSPRHLLRPVAHDQGDTWIVTYDAPEDSAGGTPTIEINKRTSRVVYATHSQ
jgi:hypothetical protein